jgi:hypothetical protein
MDASDVIRKIRTQTRYCNTVNTFAVTQPLANISSPTVESLKTVINYKDYDQRLDVAIGKYYATNASTTGLAFIINNT